MNPFDIDSFVEHAGLIGMMVLLFVETGLLIGFIFPGDSLIFVAGAFSAQGGPFPHWITLVTLLPLAAAAGDQMGYFIGKKAGPTILHSRIGQLIGPEPVAQTQRFFNKYGPATVLFARFIGIVRTLVPVMAGFSGMNHRRFTIFSLLGSFLWCISFVTLGYFMGQIPFIRDHLELLVLFAILTVLIPTAGSLIARIRKARREGTLDPAAPPEPRHTNPGGTEG